MEVNGALQKINLSKDEKVAKLTEFRLNLFQLTLQYVSKTKFPNLKTYKKIYGYKQILNTSRYFTKKESDNFTTKFAFKLFLEDKVLILVSKNGEELQSWLHHFSVFFELKRQKLQEIFNKQKPFTTRNSLWMCIENLFGDLNRSFTCKIRRQKRDKNLERKNSSDKIFEVSKL